MNAPIARRTAFEVRRDAAEVLPNGRIRYRALFSRWGGQDYPSGPEWRPYEEVFHPRALASQANLPGALLHPAKNYNTTFGVGAYPVRGVTGDKIIAHSDGVHTAGDLIVWDDEWNGLIQSAEVAELSLGYSIDPDPTPITVDGVNYRVQHRDIIADHVAGVPEGNAGTAVVLLDAATVSKIHPATREAMAAIAAERLDARTRYFDLGRWPSRRDPKPETPTMDKDKLIKALAKLDAKGRKAMLDAMVEIKGEQNDPVIAAIIASLSAAPAAAAEPEAPAGTETPSAEPPPNAEGQPVADEPGEDPEAKMDAAMRRPVSDAALAIAEVVMAARDALGSRYADAIKGKTPGEIKRIVVGKVDSGRLTKLDAAPKRLAEATLEVQFGECVELLARRNDWGSQLLEQVRAGRDDAAHQTEKLDGPISRQQAALAPKPTQTH